MKRKPILRAEPTPIRVLVLTMDTHLASAAERTLGTLRRELPGLSLELHAAAEWSASAAALTRTLIEIERADIIFANMLFLEEHYQPILGALKARREGCDALVCAISAGEVVRLTRLGSFDMSRSGGGPMALLRRLRGSRRGSDSSSGAQQMRMLRRIPAILRFIPGVAQDVRHYFLTLQYWLGGSEDNLTNLVRMLVSRYASGARSQRSDHCHGNRDEHELHRWDYERGFRDQRRRRRASYRREPDATHGGGLDGERQRSGERDQRDHRDQRHLPGAGISGDRRGSASNRQLTAKLTQGSWVTAYPKRE